MMPGVPLRGCLRQCIIRRMRAPQCHDFMFKIETE